MLFCFIKRNKLLFLQRHVNNLNKPDKVKENLNLIALKSTLYL